MSDTYALDDDMPEVMRKWYALRYKSEQAWKDCSDIRGKLKEAEAQREVVDRDFRSQTDQLREYIDEALGGDKRESELKEEKKAAW